MLIYATHLSRAGFLSHALQASLRSARGFAHKFSRHPLTANCALFVTAMAKRKRSEPSYPCSPPCADVDSRTGSVERPPGLRKLPVSGRASRGRTSTTAISSTPPTESSPALQPPLATSPSDLPLPFTGRLGYACLNTYLRTCSPPIFCSRTCRISTLLAQPSALAYLHSLGLQNARDLATLIRWNERYHIRFLRISSEIFPFASHETYGYDLGFAVPVLKEAGELAMQWGHRLTAHPGQYTQLGSPREEVIRASVRDLEYHAQMLKGLGLKGQTDRDAVMILHMGGVYGDRAATLARFEENYEKLDEEVKARLVLENDDVSWSVHDLLPICEKLNIPLVLDYHHHNIVHEEGHKDIRPSLDRIAATWTRKGITQKQHYSEPRKDAKTDRDRRKHSPRVWSLPPCPKDVDLMIEAKDKEQAVFELYRKFGIVPEAVFNDVVPHERTDENRIVRGKTVGGVVPNADIGMGGEEKRVYWPPEKEEWLLPKKVRKTKVEDSEVVKTPKKRVKTAKQESGDSEHGEANINADVGDALKPSIKRPRRAAGGASSLLQMHADMVKAPNTAIARHEPAGVETATRKLPRTGKFLRQVKSENGGSWRPSSPAESRSEGMDEPIAVKQVKAVRRSSRRKAVVAPAEK